MSFKGKSIIVLFLILLLGACGEKEDVFDSTPETGLPDMDPLDLIETAEENLEDLDTYSVTSSFAVEFGSFAPDEEFDDSCNVDRANVAMYCNGGFELVRLGDTFWRASQYESYKEPVESTMGRRSVLIGYFEFFGIPGGLIRFANQGFPTVEISDFVNDVQFVQETTFDDAPVYEFSFTVDDSYHDALRYRGSLATSTMGSMRETAIELDGSGTGTVLIDKELILIRQLIIDSNAQVDDFEATTALRITFRNFNEPVTIPDPESE